MPIRIRLGIYLFIAFSLIMSLMFYAHYVQQQLYLKLSKIQSTSSTLVQSTIELDNNFQKQLLAWTNLLLRGQNDNKYHEYLTLFYDQERNTRNDTILLIDKLTEYQEARQTALRFKDAHNLVGLRFREALEIYNESTTPAYDADSFVLDSVNTPVLLINEIKNNILKQQKLLLETTQNRFHEEELVIFIVFIILTINIVTIFLLLIDKYYGKPLSKTINVAKNIAQGDYKQRIDENLPGEFNLYATAFNQMIDQIAATNKELVSNMNNLENEIVVRKELEQELKNKRLVAEDAARSKSEFLSTMSHELRTPLNVVTGYVELLQTTDLSETQRNYIHSIQSGSTSLLSIINDVLDFAKIEAGKLGIDFSALSVTDILDELNNMFTLAAKEKNLRFSISTTANVPNSIVSDFNRIKQILVNLLSNAIKFTENGHVNLLVDARPTNNPTTINLFFTVEDSGIGIHEEYLDKIFNHFEQQSGQDSRKYGGSGLGLAISKKLALLLNGDLTVTSTIDHGSRFTLALYDIEITQSDSTPTSKSPEVVLPKSTILIADDMEANRKLIMNYLRSHPVQFIEAANGNEAVKMAQEHKPDLILMDIKMPDMDGIEATQILRNDDSLKDIPIIAISASSIHEDNAELKETLFDEYLTKPIRMSNLVQQLSRYLKH